MEMHDPDRGFEHQNPVIIIPGILGSKIVAADSAVSHWGDFRHKPGRRERDAHARKIALPMRSGAALHELTDTMETDGTLGHVQTSIGGISIRLNAYGDVLSVLGVGSYSGTWAARPEQASVDQGADLATAFEFDYDWRRSLDENAARLEEFIRQATRFLQLQYAWYGPIKFDVVAHSMGGLVLRYFLRYGGQPLPLDGSRPTATWAGAACVDTAVIVGAPNAGSLFGLERLVSGLAGNPVHPAYDPVILATMPSVYQLLPRSRHRPFQVRGEPRPVDLLDPALWVRMGWGLADSSRARQLAKLLPGVESAAERKDIAMDHLHKCLANASAFHTALDIPAAQPQDIKMHLVAGDRHPTPILATAAPGDPVLRYERSVPGDKVVPRSSALLDERAGGSATARLDSPIPWESVTFVTSDHMGLIQDPIFIHNLLYLLQEQPRRR